MNLKSFFRKIIFCAGAGLLAAGLPASLFCAEPQPQPAYSVYRGVSHIHSQYSHDSNAPLSLILDTARAAKLDFVIVTDHNSLKARTDWPNAYTPPPLLIFGEEVSGPDGHLILMGIPQEPAKDMSSQALIDWAHSQGGYAFLPHPFCIKNPWKNWDVQGWDGLEVYNFGHSLFEGGEAVDLFLRSFSESDDAILKDAQQINPEHFAFADQVLQQRKMALIAGADAHLKRTESWFQMALNSHTLYVVSPALEEKEILRALAEGRSFVVFETHGRAPDFSFWAAPRAETPAVSVRLQDVEAPVQAGSAPQKYRVGDEILQNGPVVFHVHAPDAAKIRLVHNGVVAAEQAGTDLTFESAEKGPYRVEVDRDGQLWIFTNAIYLGNPEIKT